MKKYIILWIIGSILTIIISYFVITFQTAVQAEPVIIDIYQTIASWIQIDEFSGEVEKELPVITLQGIYHIQSGNQQYFFWISQNDVFIATEQDYYWRPWIKIKDVAKDTCHVNNKPMAFITEHWKLLLTVLDTCGGGSMEGVVSVLELQVDWTRKSVSCYNYDNWSIFEYKATEYELENNKRYIHGTTQFDKLEVLPLETCKDNVKVIYLM
jgi:hypothetical protein